MKIKRFDTGFVQVPNKILYSNKLSWKAKAIYAYMLSKPHDYDFAAKRMAEESNEGEKAIRSAIKELNEFGILQKKKLKSGRIEYYLFSKVEPKQPSGQTAERVTISNTNSKAIPKGSDDPAIEELADNKSKKIVALISMFKKWNPAAVRWYSNKTQRDACSILLDNYDMELLSIIICVYIPLANGLDYIKNIKTPLQLLENIATYSTSLEKQGFFETYKLEISKGINELKQR